MSAFDGALGSSPCDACEGSCGGSGLGSGTWGDPGPVAVRTRLLGLRLVTVGLAGSSAMAVVPWVGLGVVVLAVLVLRASVLESL